MIKEQLVAAISIVRSPKIAITQLPSDTIYGSVFIIIILKNLLSFSNVSRLQNLIKAIESPAIAYSLAAVMVIGISVLSLFLWSFVAREILKIFDRIISFRKTINLMGYSHVVQVVWYIIFWLIWILMPGEYRAYLTYSGTLIAGIAMSLPFVLIGVWVYGLIIYGLIISSAKEKYDETIPKETLAKIKRKKSNWNAFRIFIILTIVAAIVSVLRKLYFG